VAVTDEDSFLTARRVTREEGLLIGGSCGTAVAAALVVGEDCGPDDLIVVLLPDSGRGYLSRLFDDDWMARYGFLRCDGGACVADVVEARGDAIPPLVYVHPEDTVQDAVRAMRKHNLSQLPVAKGEMPLAAAEIMGAVSELSLMDRTFRDASLLERAVGEVMSPPLPTVGIGQSVELAVEILDAAPAMVVLSGGRPTAVLSRSDVLAFLSPAVEERS
jgi:cystathionine beta-synthase